MNYTPKETQYKGVVYRSKTEAMFAMLIDIRARAMKSTHIYFYEPTFLKTDGGYIPDFMTIDLTPSIFKNGDFSLLTSLYEVKPSMPNDNYLNYIENIFKNYQKKDKWNHINFYSLVVFNPYQKIYKNSILDYDSMSLSSEMDTPPWVKDEYFDLILNYRFDLNR